MKEENTVTIIDDGDVFTIPLKPRDDAALVPTQDNDLLADTDNQLHYITETWPARLYRWTIDEGLIFWLCGLAAIGVAAAIVIRIVISLMSLVYVVTGFLTTQVSSIGGLLAAAAIILYIRRGRNSSNYVVVKGCGNGPTPGPQTIRR